MQTATLAHAQSVALRLFKKIEENKLVQAGKTESGLVAEIMQLATEQYGIRDHWHKKIVRAGINTLARFDDNPPDRTIAEDDMVFIDLGPIVNGFEADLGRTYVVGHDPAKQQLKNEIEWAWFEIQHWVQKQSHLRACDLYAYCQQKAASLGWSFSGIIAGHIIGKYPHEQPPDPKSWELDIHPENANDIFMPDKNGEPRHWILELQLADFRRGYGAFFEQLL